MSLTPRTHSLKVRSLFDIAPTGPDIIRGRTRTEVKETYGSRARFCVKPKDLMANQFLFYFPDTNLWALVRKADMPVKRIAASTATTLELSDVKRIAFFMTTLDHEIYERVMG